MSNQAQMLYTAKRNNSFAVLLPHPIPAFGSYKIAEFATEAEAEKFIAESIKRSGGKQS